MARKKAETAAPPRMVALQAEVLLEASRTGALPIGADAAEAIKALVDRMTPSAAEAMTRLAVENPDAFLKHFLNMAEFKLPKLARVKHQVDGQVDHRHFVAVEKREERPVIDVKVVS
jgi:hypothetical protein